jgi:flagellin-like hook-associated protein FlgL
MSSIGFRHNSASGNTILNLNRATKNLSKNFERLSSGMRINRPSDDIAGKMVAESLKADVGVFQQGIRNFNDGVSLLSIAEGAITEMKSLVSRIGEIANKSANGTLSLVQRKPLQSEVEALQSEYNRILKSASFNNRDVLTGPDLTFRFQGGYGESGGFTAQIGNALLSTAFGLNSAGETTRTSTNAGGVQSNGVDGFVSMSADGKYIAFYSEANNLIPGVSGQQAYVKNTETGAVVLASSNIDGTGQNGTLDAISISQDGKSVIFIAVGANNLVPGVTGVQVYKKNLETSEVTLISSTSAGTQSSPFTLNIEASVNYDGTLVAFDNDTINLVPGVTGQQVYIKNTITNETILVSSNANGDAATSGSASPSISTDGQFVAFTSGATNLVTGVTGTQIYVKNIATGDVQLASASKDGVAANSVATGNARISADGRYVIFNSQATNLVAGVSGNQIYRKDMQTGELSVVSASVGGVAGNSSSFAANISNDGRFVSFHSNATNLVSGVGAGQVYRKDMETGEVQLVSRSTQGTVSNSGSIPFLATSAISADGRFVAFDSVATNLVANDTNGNRDIFLRDLSTAGINEIAGMLVTSQVSAKITSEISKKYLDELAINQGKIGASLSRLSSATSLLESKTENLKTAVSQIIDTDVAKEAEEMIRNQIIQQSAIAVLAQANLQPQVVLSLLKMDDD